MDQALVSIIIPVYKTQEYLDECMDSVLVQDYPAIEIILVDDGSPDACPKMCDDYGQRYGNVRVIHHANCGLGLSRNAGMDAARGDYLLFLDSDDKLDGAGAVSALVSCAKETEADIVVGSYRRFCGSQVSAVNVTHLSGERSYTRTVDFRFQGFIRYGHLSYAWGKLYRTAFLREHGLRCRAYPFTQDKAHNMACLAYEPVYAFLETSVCLYRYNESSVTFRYKANFMPVWISIASEFEDFLQERHIPNQYKDLAAFHIFIGSFFLTKQELQRAGLIQAARRLREYGANPYVKKYMRELAFGKYVRQIRAGMWGPAIRCAALLFAVHGYGLYAFGIALMRGLRVDGRITDSRYRAGAKRAERGAGKRSERGRL